MLRPRGRISSCLLGKRISEAEGRGGGFALDRSSTILIKKMTRIRTDPEMKKGYFLWA